MAAHYDLTIDQGATLRRSFQWLDETSTPINITGCHIRARIFRLHVPEPELTCTDETGEFTITDPLAGQFDLEIEDEVTDTLLWTDGSWRLDVLHADGSITALREGAVTVRSRRGDTNGNGADETVIIMTTGIQGPVGPAGPEGPAGSGGGTYTAGAGLALTANSFAIDPAGTVATGNETIGVAKDSSGATDLLINPTTKTSGNLIDAQVNGVSKFKVDFAGAETVSKVLVAAGTASAPSIAFAAFPDAGFYNRGVSRITMAAGGAAQVELSAFKFALGSVVSIGWASLNVDQAATDTDISRQAPGILQIGTAANAVGHLALRSILLQPLTIATLPTGVAGRYAYVTDGDAALAWGATVINSGAGATKYLVWHNGAAWTVAGK